MKSATENLGKVSPTIEGQHNEEKSYDRLSIVVSVELGISYISRCPVPRGIPIINTKYWMPLGIPTNRLPLAEQLGDSSFIAMTQKYLTQLWNEQYAFNERVGGAVEISQATLAAIDLLSKDQQDALKLAGAIYDCTNRLEVIERQLNGYSLRERDEDTFEDEKINNLLDDDTLYFVYEKEEKQEEED